MHRWTDGANWSIESLGNTAVPAASAPTAASWGSGHLDVFWRDTSNQIKWLGFDRSKKGTSGYTSGGWFTAERVVATGVTGDPAAVERTTNIVDLFWRDSTGKLFHKYSNNGGSGWSAALALGVASATVPSATSWGTQRLDVVYGVDSTHLGHLWIDGSTGSWDPSHETLASSQALGVPVGVSAAGRRGRVDVFASPSGTKLSHTLFQESLPGYQVVRQPNGDWCWAASATSVLDYVYAAAGKTTTFQQCALVNLELNRSDCCTIDPSDKINGVANPSPCLTGGDVAPLLTDYSVKSSTSNPPMPASALKYWLGTAHQPVISHHLHYTENPPSGHFVVLTDMYELNGQNMVVISDPGWGNYVEVYENYLSNPCGTGLPSDCGTKVDFQLYNFHF